MKPVCILIALVRVISAQDVMLPNAPDSVKFAVIGDSGTGNREQYEVAEQMARMHSRFPFRFVLMVGDNLYGGESPRDFERKFERPYGPLLERGVTFHASLGNHDNPNQRYYAHFNMNGRRFYEFKRGGDVRFIALDSTYLGADQLEWLGKTLPGKDRGWDIAFFHHPLYSSGKRHGPDDDLRRVLEPEFIKHGVDVVFTGHEHFYERMKPQNGIYHFIVGSSGKLRKGNIKKTAVTAAGFDRDYCFLLVEITPEKLCFQAITRKGVTVDSGTLPRLGTTRRLTTSSRELQQRN